MTLQSDGMNSFALYGFLTGLAGKHGPLDRFVLWSALCGNGAMPSISFNKINGFTTNAGRIADTTQLPDCDLIYPPVLPSGVDEATLARRW